MVEWSHTDYRACFEQDVLKLSTEVWICFNMSKIDVCCCVKVYYSRFASVFTSPKYVTYQTREWLRDLSNTRCHQDVAPPLV